MAKSTFPGTVAVAGIGQSEYYRHGKSPDPEVVLGFKAILAACEDAGIDPRDIDGRVGQLRPKRPHQTGSSARHPRASLQQHGVGRRRRGRVSCGRQRRGGRARRTRGNSRGVPGPGTGPVLPFQSGPLGRPRLRSVGLHASLRSDLPRPALRRQGIRFMHEHGIQQEALRAIALAYLPPRPAKSQRRDVRQAAGRADL